jgi:hypothetical protein
VIASGVKFPETVSKEAAEIARLIREGSMDQARKRLKAAMGGSELLHPQDMRETARPRLKMEGK